MHAVAKDHNGEYKVHANKIITGNKPLLKSPFIHP
jgi:hypothetical protein